MTSFFSLLTKAGRLAAAAALCAAALAGCQVPPKGPTEAELIAMANALPTEDDIRERFHQVGSVVHEICNAPEFAAYFEKTPCLPSLITDKHKLDGTHITEQQKDAMRMALREFDELNRVTRSMMVESQLDNYVVLAHEADAIDVESHANQRKLLSGEITWGAYNRERQRLALLFVKAAEKTRMLDTDEQSSGR